MAELQPIIVFHGRHFVRHLGICNPICAKILQAMSGIIPRNLKKTTSLPLTVFLASTNAAYTQSTHRHTQRHTHTHAHMSIAIGAMQCVAFRLKIVQYFIKHMLCLLPLPNPSLPTATTSPKTYFVTYWTY